ncbi:lysine--tRNA ligase [archaeon]|nr:lysine--tRNA ligase [archaeon]|tara:strand:- start:59 stop:1597 length:1539 start_codon:yes stop_codon:yes gene_type:complete
MKNLSHWADIAAKKVTNRSKKKAYTCAAGITPSGTVHIGNFREIITTDIVVKALEKLGKKVKFIYSWDDYDRFRKVPKNVPKELEKYIGLPLSEVPDPFKCHKSYAEHFEKEVENSLKNLEMDIEFIRQNEMHKKCKYSKQIKEVLNKRNKIKNILNKYRKEPFKEYWPLTVYCEKCKKDSTEILNYDKNYEIQYKCECGFSNKIDFRKKGIVKLKWRSDWCARWIYEKVDFEPGGKDHFAAGGSYETGKQIIKEVWNKEAPDYVIYEWISIKGGKEFSSSTGEVTNIDSVLEIYEPEILRWIFAGTRPGAGFSISFDLDVLKLYEDFDYCERIYFNKEKINNKKEESKQKRIYELSNLKIPKKLPEQPSFRHMTVLVQTYEGDIEKAIKGYKSPRVKKRAECAWNWIQKYAPEEMKFKVHKKIPEKIKKSLNEKQIQTLKELINKLKKKSYTQQSLFEEFYKICKKVDIKNTDFFKGAYLALIGKEKGPKLAPFILVLGKNRIIEILKQLS